MFEKTNRMTDWQGLKQNEGLFITQEIHFHGTDGWKKKKKQIYAKMKAVGRMNWALSKTRALVSLFDEDIVFEFH
ncbi:unnamed protein product [Cercopithifilaria johnstoni]|uniref:Uncharacterized protein n=1 Tax=Cercopithifilaria johnstoni TaxID=2874296 RepID=A0A8J2Q2N8_9BILA|nr:unnamed protein product [Cercopithifilaria johnstoni]